MYAVADHIIKQWPEAEVTDYIKDPKSSGYRAVHVIERRDGRLIEIQLRTQRQDQWAVAVETWLPPAVLFNLKDDPDSAPQVVRQYFETAGDVLALADQGAAADDTLMAKLGLLRDEISPHIQRPTEGQ